MTDNIVEIHKVRRNRRRKVKRTNGKRLVWPLIIGCIGLAVWQLSGTGFYDQLSGHLSPDQSRKISDSPYPSGLTGVDLFCLPIPGHEVVEAVHFMIRDAGENPAEPGFRIDTVHAASLNKRVGDCSGIAAAL